MEPWKLCRSLSIEKEDIPISKPIIYLLGKIKETCNVTDLDYHMTIEVNHTYQLNYVDQWMSY